MIRRFEGSQLLVATHNSGKLQEMQHLLEPKGITVTGAAQMLLPEPDETGTTFVENADPGFAPSSVRPALRAILCRRDRRDVLRQFLPCRLR